jgi:transposase
MAITLPDSRELSDEVLQALRLRALRGLELGFTQADIADVLGVARETVCRWWTSYNTGGLDAIPQDRTGRPVGTGRTLSTEQEAHLQHLIDTRSPEDLGIASPLWNRRAIRDLIHNECGIMMPVRTVGEYLRRWGYTAKKPCRHNRKQDPEEVREWLEMQYPLIKKQADKEQATIFWCDETGIEADEHPGYGYAREGQRATMEVSDPHIRMNMISAISNTGELRFLTYSGTMTAVRFIEFLDRLLRSTPGTLFVIVDSLAAHEKDTVTKWVEKHEERLAVFYLPRRSPELNPDEYLNNDLKGQVNDEGLPDTCKDLRSRIQRFMHKLLKLPEHVMSYFCHPCVQYAAPT